MCNVRDLKCDKAKNAFGDPLQGSIVPKNPAKKENTTYFLLEETTGKKIGFISFSIVNNAVFINQMENYTRNNNKKCTGVGSLLYDFVFYKMAQTKLVCPLQLIVADKSWVFHYKNGFRFKDHNENTKMDALIKHGGRALETLPKDAFNTNMAMPIETVREKMSKFAEVKQLASVHRNSL